MTNEQGNQKVWTPTHEAVLRTLMEAFGAPTRHFLFPHVLPLRDITVHLYDNGFLKSPPARLSYGFTKRSAGEGK